VLLYPSLKRSSTVRSLWDEWLRRLYVDLYRGYVAHLASLLTTHDHLDSTQLTTQLWPIYNPIELV
jgi:hypothetical protein